VYAQRIARSVLSAQNERLMRLVSDAPVYASCTKLILAQIGNTEKACIG
jgi:hypothetical protein